VLVAQRNLQAKPRGLGQPAPLKSLSWIDMVRVFKVLVDRSSIVNFFDIHKLLLIWLLDVFTVLIENL
jgi:hypothetical protein